MSAISLFQQTTSIFVTRRHNSISGKETHFYGKTSTSFTWQIYGWAPLLSTCMWSFKRNCYGNLNLVTSWLFDIWWKGKLPGPDDHCPPKLILNPNLAKSRSPLTSISFAQSFRNFVQSTALPLSYSVQNFKLIGQLRNTLRKIEISRDLSSKRVSMGYPIPHQPLADLPVCHSTCSAAWLPISHKGSENVTSWYLQNNANNLNDAW